MLFAGLLFLIGTLDELAIDLLWLWLRLTGRARTERIADDEIHRSLTGPAAVFIPAWREAAVIGPTVRHALQHWPHDRLRLYVGCYRNDPATIDAVLAAAQGDPRLRLVIHGRHGPSTKADCLNRLYRALEDDERRGGVNTRMVVMHDAEDMIDRAALSLLDAHIEGADLVQLPVLPHPLRGSRWIASHYCDEFAEQHGKGMVVRDALRAGLPTAGVGCAIARHALAALDRKHGGLGPFAAECLTEDYELGLGVGALGGRSRFVRCRTADGRLIATRACFPARLDWAVRQKTRWVHGIAFQGWDRLGWTRHPIELWMRMRDRRGPLTAIVLAAAYLLLLLAGLLWLADLAGLGRPWKADPLVELLLIAGFASFLWRGAMRFAFTAREYGFAEGVWAVLRIPVANVIAIMAGRRALFAYLRTLRGALPQWDKTHHEAHPVLMRDRAGT